MTEEIKLPPLPEPYGWFDIRGEAADGFTADQMRAYARLAVQEAVAAEREQWHALMRQICDLSDGKMRDGDEARNIAAKALGFSDYDEYCANEYRAEEDDEDDSAAIRGATSPEGK